MFIISQYNSYFNFKLKNEQVEQEKHEAFAKKLEELDKKKTELALKNKRKFFSDEGSATKHAKLIEETRLRFEQANIDYKNKLERKLNEIEERKMKKKQITERNLIKKYNFLTMMREDNFEKTVRYEKIQDYLKEKKMEKINERMHRIETLQ